MVTLIALIGDVEVNSKLKRNLVDHCSVCHWNCAQNRRNNYAKLTQSMALGVIYLSMIMKDY